MLFADTGEVDLDALLEDLCIMEKDLNSNNSTSGNNEEHETFFENHSYSPKVKSPISPTAKVKQITSIKCLLSNSL